MGFSYKSRRSRDGFAFQNKLLEEIKSAGIEASDVRTFFTEKANRLAEILPLLSYVILNIGSETSGYLLMIKKCGLSALLSIKKKAFFQKGK